MLPATDHSKVYYRPFRKDFYVEVAALFNFSFFFTICFSSVLLFAAILEQINVAKRGVGASRTPRIHQRFCSHRGRPSLPPCEVYELLPNLLEKNTTLTYLSADYCRLYFRLNAYILLNTTARESGVSTMGLFANKTYPSSSILDGRLSVHVSKISIFCYQSIRFFFR